ncbi:hypothetical protein [Kribbella deserti]|uniref:Uncharacterized protein n=1 Tax=Kribbella deserti TaxID=1926257 RepID=A0ABV6QNE1_9ACTN
MSVLTSLTSNSPAWAVEDGPGDTVTVRINEFRDPQGLERRLHAEGIPAIVDYIPPGKACSRDGRTWNAGPNGKPSAGRNDTKFQIRKSDIGTGQALSIFAVTVTGQHKPALFTTEVVRANTSRCELTDATLPTVPPSSSPSSPQSSSNPTASSSR